MMELNKIFKRGKGYCLLLNPTKYQLIKVTWDVPWKPLFTLHTYIRTICLESQSWLTVLENLAAWLIFIYIKIIPWIYLSEKTKRLGLFHPGINNIPDMKQVLNHDRQINKINDSAKKNTLFLKNLKQKILHNFSHVPTEYYFGDFPRNSVAKTECSQCREGPCSGN